MKKEISVKNAEVKIEKMHKLAIEDKKLSIDGKVISHLKFLKQEIVFEFPNRSTLTLAIRELKPGSLIETEIDEYQFNSISREWENK